MAPTLPQANFHVFVHSGEVFSSPNRSFLPPIPLRHEVIPTTPDAKDALQTYWADCRYPTQPFTPLAPRLDTEPYRSLKIIDDRIIVKVGIYWRLKPSLINSWKVIENHLLFISNTLFNRSSMMLPLEALAFPPPSKYGYTRNHRNRKSAFISASNSRDAFFSLMGWCSYTIFAFHGPGQRPWQWEHILLENKFSAITIQQLAESELLDFSSEYRRAGVFLDSHCKMLPLIPPMIKANIPVWIHWGSLNKPSPLIPNLSQYRPNIAEIHQAPKTFNPKPVICPAKSPIFSAVDLETASSGVVLPKPEPSSRQKYGEKWQAFFIRMAERNARVVAQESSNAKRARLAREAKEKDHWRPAKSSKGPAVFHWEIDAASNFRMRKLMSKREVDDEWSNYTNTQRRYDSFHNEWDICTEFDPDAYAPNYEDDDNDCFYGTDNDILNPSSAQLERGALDVVPPVYMSTLHDEQIIDGPFSLSFAHTISDMAFERYGFIDLGNIALESDIPDDKEWKTVLRTFCKASSKGENRVRAAIKQFLNNLLEAKPNGFFSDLSADAVHPLSEHANPSFRLSPRRVYLQSGEAVSVYLIEPRAADHGDVCWQLLVNDAATALDCMRGYHHTPFDIVRFMVQSGRVFRTYSHFNILQGREEPRRWHRGFSLGWRELANKPQASEYTSYEQLRGEFFRQPHARAALMKGGIVWRLALEHVQGLAEELVLEGPSDEVLTRGTCWRLNQHDRSDSIWDDDLSSDELDFICGVYKLYTSDVGRNTADVSWWPKHSTFLSSGLNVGHWTDACEDWFQARHLQIVEGRAELKTATQWFNSLKYDKNTKRLMKRNIEAAEAYLRDQRSTPLKT